MPNLTDRPDVSAGVEYPLGSASEWAGEALREGVPTPTWTPQRTERLLAATQRRMARRRQVQGAGATLLAMAAVLLATLQLSPLFAPPRSAPPMAQGTPAAESIVDQKVIRFGDGSQAELSSASAELDVERVSADAIDINLHRGRSDFRVTPNRSRVFTVRAGEVMVTVLGTEFTVEKRSERTWVRVTRGKVSVDWPGGNRLLLAGDEGQFPPEEPKPVLELPLEPEAVPPRAVPAPTAQIAVVEADTREGALELPLLEQYRDRAKERDFDKAYELLKASPKVVGSDPGELMLAADVARLSGHPAEAVPYLRRVLTEHSGDSRAPLAAFTLGRLYLGQLGSPGEAAQAFARVRVLAPSGPLAEDALAREVEARARAGEAGKAQELARQYLQRYPVGRRTAIVRAHGGLEAPTAAD